MTNNANIPTEEIPITYVTNGVHYPTWADKDWQKFYEETFDKKFLNDQSNEAIWNAIQKVDDEKIWKMRQKKQQNWLMRKRVLGWMLHIRMQFVC